MSEISMGGGAIEPPELTADMASKLSLRAKQASVQLADQLDRYNVYGVYAYTRSKKLSNEMKAMIRSVVDPQQMTVDLLNGYVKLHPYSRAQEFGLTVGLAYSDHLLPARHRSQFHKRMYGNLAALKRRDLYLSPGPEDYFSKSGRDFAEELCATAGNKVATYDIEIVDPHHEALHIMYANAIGYVGAAALTKMTEVVLRRGQPSDPQSVVDFRDDIEFINDKATIITPDMFGA